MAKATFICTKCDEIKKIEFEPGEIVLVPKCESCGNSMQRDFRVSRGNSMDNATFGIARMMAYHKSKD